MSHPHVKLAERLSKRLSETRSHHDVTLPPSPKRACTVNIGHHRRRRLSLRDVSTESSHVASISIHQPCGIPGSIDISSKPPYLVCQTLEFWFLAQQKSIVSPPASGRKRSAASFSASPMWISLIRPTSICFTCGVTTGSRRRARSFPRQRVAARYPQARMRLSNSGDREIGSVMLETRCAAIFFTFKTNVFWASITAVLTAVLARYVPLWSGVPQKGLIGTFTGLDVRTTTPFM